MLLTGVDEQNLFWTIDIKLQYSLLCLEGDVLSVLSR